MDALTVMQLYARDMNHYIAWADKVDKLNAVLRDPLMLDGIRARFGTEQGNMIISDMHGKLKVLSRGYTDFRPNMSLTEAMLGNVARAQLAGKIMIGVKQLDAVQLYMVDTEGLGPKEFSKGVAEFMADPVKAIGIMKKWSTYLSERGIEIDRELIKDLQGMDPVWWDKSGMVRFNINELSNKLLHPIHLGDKAAVYSGGYSLFRSLLKQGLSPEEAMLRVEKSTKELQQSLELSTQSGLQQQKGVIPKLMTLYSTMSFSLMRRSLDAVKDLVGAKEEVNMLKNQIYELEAKGAPEEEVLAKQLALKAAREQAGKNAKNAAKTIILCHFVSGSTYTLASNYGHWDTKEQIAGAILGPLSSLPILGDTVQNLVRRGLGLKQYGSSNIVMQPVGDILSAANDLFNPDKEVTAKTGRKVASGMQMFAPLPAKQAYDVMDSIVNELPEGEYKRTMMKILGGSKGKVDLLFDNE